AERGVRCLERNRQGEQRRTLIELVPGGLIIPVGGKPLRLDRLAEAAKHALCVALRNRAGLDQGNGCGAQFTSSSESGSARSPALTAANRRRLDWRARCRSEP